MELTSCKSNALWKNIFMCIKYDIHVIKKFEKVQNMLKDFYTCT